jgi:exopolysaccharide biosynthesis polyprenyl glycosylphosphotransferase
MFRERARTLQAFSLTLDVLCIGAAFAAAFVLRIFHDQLPLLNALPALPWTAESAVRSDYAVLLVASAVAWVVAMRSSGVYQSHRAERVGTILLTYGKALVWALLATGAVTFVLKMQSISRMFFGYYFGSAFMLLLAKQMVVITLLGRFRQLGYNQRHALVIGAGKPVAWFASVIQESSHTGYNLVGVLLSRKIISAETSEVPVLGTVDDLDQVLTDYPVDEVFLVGAAADMAEMAPVAQALIEKGRVVSLITPFASGEWGVRGRITEFNGVPMVSFGPTPRDEVNSGLSRAIDVTVAAVGLACSLPVFGFVWLAMRRMDPGPLFFSQDRLGFGGETFKVHKLRSMRVDAEEVLKQDAALYKRYVENDYKLLEGEDPRISGLGGFLRKSSLDELPQLWNVLKGDMALVGPRPIVPNEIEKYGEYASMFLTARPGITGQWQVAGRSNLAYPERAFMDLDYVGQSSLASNASILIKTIPAVVVRKGAH